MSSWLLFWFARGRRERYLRVSGLHLGGDSITGASELRVCVLVVLMIQRLTYVVAVREEWDALRG
jgi:hypothetical protein